jgi:GH25 family lysozyme M1 (1,4-beta-N-acetylmuramidase)
MGNKKGIDVSQWNVISDYSAVKKAGADFAIVKSVYGTEGKIEPGFSRHITGFKSVDIPVIATYNYCYANTIAKANVVAPKFISTSASAGVSTVYLDLEDTTMMGLGSTIVDIINIYRKQAEAAGMKFGIYTGNQFYKPYLKPYASEIGDIPIWWARYPYTKDCAISDAVPDSKYLPTGITLDGWQYSSKCTISGLSGYFDLSIWYNETPFGSTSDEYTDGTANITESNPYATHEPTRVIYKGCKGDDVKWVQWYLYKFGLLMNSKGKLDEAEIDGIFGDRTKTAVLTAQKRLGMSQTGKVQAQDRAIWKKLC